MWTTVNRILKHDKMHAPRVVDWPVRSLNVICAPQRTCFLNSSFTELKWTVNLFPIALTVWGHQETRLYRRCPFLGSDIQIHHGFISSSFHTSLVQVGPHHLGQPEALTIIVVDPRVQTLITVVIHQDITTTAQVLRTATVLTSLDLAPVQITTIEGIIILTRFVRLQMKSSSLFMQHMYIQSEKSDANKAADYFPF